LLPPRTPVNQLLQARRHGARVKAFAGDKDKIGAFKREHSELRAKLEESLFTTNDPTKTLALYQTLVTSLESHAGYHERIGESIQEYILELLKARMQGVTGPHAQTTLVESLSSFAPALYVAQLDVFSTQLQAT
jgi:hypothetical protein